MFSILLIYFELNRQSLLTKREDQECLLENEGPTQTSYISYRMLEKGQFQWYENMRQRLYSFLTKNGLQNYTEFEKNILSYIISNKDESLNSFTKRQFINILRCQYYNFSQFRTCYCKRDKTIHPDLKNILRIGELLFSTKIFKKISKEVYKANVSTIKSFFIQMWSFFYDEFENDDFHEKLNCFYRSILLEIFKMFYSTTKSFDAITDQNMTYAIRKFFKVNDATDLKIKYVDETGDTPLIRIFEFSADKIQIGNFFSSADEESQKQPNIILKHMNIDESFNFYDRFEFDGKAYYVASFAFDDSAFKNK